MDPLSDVLKVSHLTAGVFLHADFHDPWCIVGTVSPEHCAPFLGKTGHIILYHYVAEGRLEVKLDGEPAFELHAGEVIILPRNDLHMLGSDTTLPPTPEEETIRPPQYGKHEGIHVGGDGKRTRLICGYLGCDSVDDNPIISMLPRYLTLTAEEGGTAEWIRTTFQYAADEISTGRSGSETVLAKLSEMLFVEAVRRYADTLPEEHTGWLAGLRDPYISKALAYIHERIDQPLTIEDVGREVGLSRSALADRFTRIIGEPPMQYLTGWRMQVAANTMRTSHSPLARIAGDVGYDSEAAFTRAFKRIFGIPPGTWRRKLTQD